MRQNILVTGGAGYIGSHTCKTLAQAGYTPVTLDNLSQGHREAVKWGPFVEGDLADKELVKDTLRQYEIAGVMHFAAFACVGESMVDPGKYFRNNLVNTITLLDAMVDTRVRKFILSSTCATYGTPQFTPITEEHPQVPVNPYGESKLSIEKSMRWYSQVHGLRVASLRYFNAAGADSDGEIGENHDPETHLIPLVIQAALGDRDSVDVFGTDYPTPDGSAIRDYIHVTDLADAHLRALNKLECGIGNMFLNLGTGNGYSVLEVIDMVEHVSGKSIRRNLSARRPGDPAELVAATELADELLSWKPVISDLRSIVETALRWHSRQPYTEKYAYQMQDSAGFE